MGQLPKDVAIRVKNVHKDFKLARHSDDSIKRRIITAFEPKDKAVDVHHVLNGISFDIKKGEFFGVVGRNGSGKSTLLKIISNIYQPTLGSVNHDGKLVAFIELGVGFNGELTGRENVYLNAAMLGFSESETDDMYEEIVAFSELERFMDQKLKNYSSGMKVRLAFSVAIRAEADILILDEVLAVGDADFQRKCYDYFKNLKEAHKSIVLVSHSMGLIKEYCDKAVLIENGRIAHQGTASEVASEYTKLFNKPSGPAQKEPKKRGGDKRIEISDIDASIDKDRFTVKVKLTAGSQPVDGVKFGFRIKDSSGRVVAGANTNNVDGSQTLSFTPNEVKNLKFEMPNILGNQTYRISGTVGDREATCDNWEDATTFSAEKDQAFYPIVCPAVLHVEEMK